MPFGTYETPKPTPLPTLLQYIKSCAKGVEGKTKFSVEIVWMPGKFDNITLQTTAFRYIVGEKHPLYQEMVTYFKNDDVFSGSKEIYIVIDSIKTGTVTLSESTKANGNWENLGVNAFIFKKT